MSVPRFSFVVPTHNRSHLLALALQSVLATDFDDFELVVSDDQSTDRTAQVVADLADSRVRYTRTPRRLTMAEHFEWAAALATGEFLMFLCDDDAVSPDLMPQVDRLIRDPGTSVVVLKSGLYYAPNHAVAALGNSLLATRYSGGSIECESAPVLRAMLGRFRNGLTPRGNNSFTKRCLIEKIRADRGRFFLPPAPDSSSCCLVLASVPSYFLLDEPLHLFGQAPESIGADQETRRGAASAAFAAAGALFELSPVHAYTVTNIIAESYLQARRLMPTAIPELDHLELYVACLRDLETLERHGVDVGADRLEMDAWSRRLGVRSLFMRHGDRWRTALALGPLGGLIRAFKHAVAPPPIRIDHQAPQIRLSGEEGGFSDIAECAARLPALRHVLLGD